MDEEQPDSQQPQTRRRHLARAALTRLGVTVATALFCMMLVFGVGWVAAVLW